MKTTLLVSCAVAARLLASDLSAHGGVYRGPGDTVPEGGYGPGGRSPGPKGPVTPRGGTPATPTSPHTPSGRSPVTHGPRVPTGRPGTPITGGGIVLQEDLSRWIYWWEFNKDNYLRLKDSLFANLPPTGGDEIFFGRGRRVVGRDTLRPGEGQITGRVVPSLLRALDATENRDINSSCMVALAKIGRNGETAKLQSVLRERLVTADQEIRETAALAMGISGLSEMVEDLEALVADSARGRELVSRSEVDDRTRSFAAYGLGLIAYRNSSLPLKKRVFATLHKVLEKEQIKSFDVKVAAINGMRLLRPGNASDAARAFQGLIVDSLMKFGAADLGKGQTLVQSHVAPAVARLTGRSGALAANARTEFARALNGTRKLSTWQYQSAALALGSLGQATETAELDEASRALVRYWQNGRDQQARYFTLISLAQIGGIANRDLLLKTLDRAKHLERPWAAMALGVWGFRNIEANDDRAEVQLVGETLHRHLKETKNPSHRGALALALGLCRHRDASSDLLGLLMKYKHQDESAGYMCLGLSLMNADRATEDIRDIVKTSVRRPQRLLQAAIALGKLGDRSAATMLEGMLVDDNQNVAKLAAIAKALGTIGDRRSLDPLIKVMFNESLTELSRAFSAVALGSICDKEDFPWSAKISKDLNYRAAVPSLTNQTAGVLDIL